MPTTGEVGVLGGNDSVRAESPLAASATDGVERLLAVESSSADSLPNELIGVGGDPAGVDIV